MKIPSGWEKKSLESVSHIQTGLAKGKIGIKNPVKKPFLRVANVQDSYFNLTDMHEIEIEQGQIERYELQFGDVVITEGGDADKLGRGHVWRNEIPGCIHQNHLFAIRAQRNKLDFEFLSALISSKYGKAYFLSCAKQSTNLASINSSQLKAFPVLLPPLPEQRRIATILSQWDNSLSILTKLIEAKRQQKRGLAEQLLTEKRRLKGFEGKWEEKRLGDFFAEISQRNSDNRPLISLSCSKVHGIVPQTQIFKKRVASEDTRRYKVLKRGDLVYDPMLLWDISIGFLESVDEGTISPAYNTFRMVSGEREYFKYLFRTHRFWQIYNDISQGTNIRRRKADATDFLNIAFSCPPLPEQQAIASLLSTLDAEITTLTALKAKVQEQKRGLMDLLLMGRVRVKIEEAS